MSNPMTPAESRTPGGAFVPARELYVSIVIGILADRDGISSACLQKIAAIRQYCRRRSVRLHLKVYTYASDFDDSAVTVVNDATQIVADLHFQSSDVVIYEFGIYSELFDTISMASRLSRVVVFYYGITPPHLYAEDQREILYRSYAQLKNVFLSDLLVTTSEHTVSELTRVGVSRDKILKLALAVDFGCSPSEPRVERYDKGDSSNLLYVGRFVPAKGVLDLVKAIDQARRDTGLDLMLSLVGSTRFSDRDYIDRIDAFVKERDLSAVVRWRCDVSRSDLQDEYREADAVVIPSYHEGFCLPVIEAYAHDCFVIGSDAGALPETIGGLGRTYKAGDVTELAARIAEFDATRVKGGYETDRGFLKADDWSQQVEAYVRSFSTSCFRSQFDRLLSSLHPPDRIGLNREMLAGTQREMLLRMRGATFEPLSNPVERKLRSFIQTLPPPVCVATVSCPPPSPKEATPMETSVRVVPRVALARRLKSIPVIGKILVHVKRSLVTPLRGVAPKHALRGFLVHVKRSLVMPRTAHSTYHRLLEFERKSEAQAERLRNEIRASSDRSQVRLQEQMQAQVERLGRELRGDLARFHQTSKDQWSKVEESTANYGRWLESLTADVRGQNSWLETLSTQFQGQSELFVILARKLQMLSMDVRERNADGIESEQIPSPRIVDPEAYARRVEEMGGRPRVNLGCGERPLPDYINVDFREMPEVDIVADIRDLPFEPGSLAELMSAHLVEHFRQHQFEQIILPYWRSLLAEGGTLRVICPNWGAMLKRLADGGMTYDDFRQVTFGAQDYTGDDHFAMYTPESLSKVLRDGGFGDIEVLAADRMNGMCPELEMTAVAGCRALLFDDADSPKRPSAITDAA